MYGWRLGITSIACLLAHTEYITLLCSSTTVVGTTTRRMSTYVTSKDPLTFYYLLVFFKVRQHYYHAYRFVEDVKTDTHCLGTFWYYCTGTLLSTIYSTNNNRCSSAEGYYPPAA
mmetsp:Transcript_31686/g.36960  ORF Transcript_31686/g.36960 Transcript_31686/m.36960 type:complete len:115 (+) Transcript_31686:156-500(+)